MQELTPKVDVGEFRRRHGLLSLRQTSLNRAASASYKPAFLASSPLPGARLETRSSLKLPVLIKPPENPSSDASGVVNHPRSRSWHEDADPDVVRFPRGGGSPGRSRPVLRMDPPGCGLLMAFDAWFGLVVGVMATVVAAALGLRTG